MASQLRNNLNFNQYLFVCVISIALMVLDSRTTVLNTPRDILSIIVQPVQIAASLPVNINRFFSNVMSAEPDVKIAYDNLRTEYFQLKSEALLLRALHEENNNLRVLLNAPLRVDEKITLAELVNVKIDPYSHRFLVDRGLSNDAYVGQAVIDDQGIIGQVTEAMSLSSSVMLITDPNHSIPVQIQRNGMRTVLNGTGSIALLRAPFLNQNSDVMVGDVLLSSGLGGRFPSGYPVAVVKSIDVSGGEAFMRVSATPLANLERSNYVLLLSRKTSYTNNISRTHSIKR